MGKETRISRRNIKKPFYKRVWFWVILIVIVLAAKGALSNGSGNSSSDTASAKSENVASKKSKPSTKIYKLDSDKSVKNMLKHYNYGIKYTNISGVYSESIGSKTVGLTIKENGNDLSNKMAMRNAGSDILQTWDAFKKSKGTNFENIAIMVTYPTNNGRIPIIKVQISGNRLKSFNKKASSSSNVPDIATKYWQRNDLPSLK
jgi:hypothetical protein